VNEAIAIAFAGMLNLTVAFPLPFFEIDLNEPVSGLTVGGVGEGDAVGSGVDASVADGAVEPGAVEPGAVEPGAVGLGVAAADAGALAGAGVGDEPQAATNISAASATIAAGRVRCGRPSIPRQ